MKNLKQIRSKSEDTTTIEKPTNLNTEAVDYHAAAMAASEHAKKQPSVSTHRAASTAHDRAIEWHTKKADALVKKGGSSEEVKKHEDHIKMHKNEAQKHRFAAHRIGKTQQNEGLEDACWKGYEAIGKKMKDGKEVPNCVPKEGHAEDAQAAHQAAHAALKKGDLDTYHNELDKKFAAHQEAEKEAKKKPVQTFEATEKKPYDPNEPLNAHTQKAIHRDYLGYKAMSTKDVLRHHRARHRVTSNYSAADAGGKQGMISGLLRHKYGDRHLDHYFGVKESSDDKNLRITKHEKLAVEAEKRGDKQAQQYHLELVTKLKNESVNEATAIKAGKHLVVVTVTDPNHPMVTKRKEPIMKRVRVGGTEKDARKRAESFYKKQGLKVHDSYYHSAVNESLDTDEFVDSYDPEQGGNEDDGIEEIRMAKGQLKEIVDMANDIVEAMDDEDELEAWVQNKLTTAYDQIDDVYSYLAYGNAEDSKEEDPKEAVSEETEAGEEGDEDGRNTLSRLKTLIRLGLIEESSLQVTLRAVKKLENDQQVVSTSERQAINDLLEKLLGVVTGDDTLFRKVKLAVQK